MKIVILVNIVIFFDSGESCYYSVSGESDSGEFGEYSESDEYCDIGDSVDFGESDSS